MSDIKALWATLRAEADMEAESMMPLCAVKTVHAPDGYRAEICVKRFQIYHRLHEVKARAVIWNVASGAAQYDTGQWVVESNCMTKLKKALEQLQEIVDYKAAMTQKKPMAEESTPDELF